MSELRLLHVHAHPDDESSKGAATTALYTSRGVRVMVATLTGGEAGSILNPAMDRPEITDNIAQVRRDEMAEACQILGVEHEWLGFVDSGLPEGDPTPELPAGSFATLAVDQAIAPLVRVLREFKPQVVTTYDELGGYPHPDHIMCNKVTLAAVQAAADPQQFVDLGEPWQVLKVYYHLTFNKRRVEALHDAVLAAGIKSPYAKRLEKWDDASQISPDRITTQIECADYFPVRNQALIAHATQVDPKGPWFAVPLEIEQRAWPTEDYELVIDHVGAPRPERDLFAGITKSGAIATDGDGEAGVL